MGLRRNFATDKNMETKGIELQYGDVVLTIARAGGANARYQKVLTSITAPYRRAIETETLPTAQANAMMREVFARSVLLGWEGVTMDDLHSDDSTEPAPFTVENAMQLFKALPDLFTDVQQQASKVALFRHDLDESDLGN